MLLLEENKANHHSFKIILKVVTEMFANLNLNSKIIDIIDSVSGHELPRKGYDGAAFEGLRFMAGERGPHWITNFQEFTVKLIFIKILNSTLSSLNLFVNHYYLTVIKLL